MFAFGVPVPLFVFNPKNILESSVDDIIATAETDNKSELKAMMKDGHPMGDFLVVGDPEEVGTWHLPVKKNGKPDAGLMGAAHAALTVGYRGNKYEGPDKKKALAKLKKMYEEMGKEMPKSLSLKMGDTPIPYIYTSATSLTEALAAEDAKETAHELMELVSVFVGVVDNICYAHEITDKRAAIKAASDELSKLLDEQASGEVEKSVNLLAGAMPTVTTSNRFVTTWTDHATGNVTALVNPPLAADGDYGSIKSLGNNRVGGYAVLWGNESQKDLTEEWFDPQTEELTVIYDTVGKLPLLYHHGLDESLKTSVIGVVDTLKADAVGLWYEAQLKLAEEYEAYVKKLLADKKLKTSTQTFPVARRVNAKTGRIERWPIVEITATPTPAEYRMQPVEVLKSAYRQVGCENFACLVKSKFGIEDEADKQGAEKARLETENEMLRLSLLDL